MLISKMFFDPILAAIWQSQITLKHTRAFTLPDVLFNYDASKYIQSIFPHERFKYIWVSVHYYKWNTGMHI